jgi:hypothetical protein
MTSTRVEEDLVAVLLYERDRSDRAVTEALLDRRSSQEPSRVRDAAERLLRAHAPWTLDLAGAAETLIDAAGDKRSRRLFVACSLVPDGRSQGELAGEEGISAQRVGQIVQKAERRVRDALLSAPGSLAWAARTLRDRLGSVTTEEAVVASLVGLGVNEELTCWLLRWLAGPYSPVPRRPGWVGVDARALVARTAECLAADGGVRPHADVESELADLGIRADRLMAWLAASRATVVHDLVVLVDGPLPDAAERLLDAYGVARTASELVADLATGGRVVDDEAVAAALRQRRFAHTAKGAVRLAEWGPEEKRPLPKKPKKQRHSAGPTKTTRPDSLGPGTSRPGKATTSPDRLWLWMKIDEEALRGSEADVPIALVEGLGIGPLARRTFSSRWGPVTLAYEGTHPTRGSVRAVALAAGARLDDTILLGFSPGGDVVVEIRPATVPAEAAPVPVFSQELASGGTR